MDERQLIRDALRRSMGESTFREVRDNLEQRIRSGEFIEVGRERPGGADRTLTTREMLRLRTRQHHPHEGRARKARAAGFGTEPAGVRW